MTTKLAVLVLSKPGFGNGAFINFDKESILIGRSGGKAAGPDSDFKLASDQSASRPHARLWLEDSVWRLEDLESKNGTFVDGARLSASQSVRAGSLIQTGATFWTLCPAGHMIFRYGQILFTCEFLPVVGLFISQNQIPTLSKAAVKNLAAAPSAPFSFTLSIQGLSDPLVITVPALGPKEEQSISCPSIPWKPAGIAELTSSQVASVSITAQHAHLPNFPSKVDTLNPWGWTTDSRFHSSLAAFVMPGHPSLSRLLQDFNAGRSAVNLKGATHPDTDETEQTRLRAFYDFFASEMTISYRLPRQDLTASHQLPCQLIRPPDQIFPRRHLRSGEATCLDLALLLGSCLERDGLFPVIVLCGDVPANPTHAMAGVWRGGSHGGKPLIKQSSLLERISQGQILLVETTGFSRNGGNHPLGFDAARRQARMTLSTAKWAVGIDVGYLRKGPRPVKPLEPV